MMKAATWLLKGHEKDTPDMVVADFSPNNIKTLVVTGKQMAVEYFVPVNDTKIELYNIEDIKEDYSFYNMNKAVTSILKILDMFYICENIEEIIVSTEGYSKPIFYLDIEELKNILPKLPRVYSVTKTSCTMQEIWALLSQAEAGVHLHFSDILAENRAKYNKYIDVKYYHKDDWYRKISSLESRFTIDKNVLRYLKDICGTLSGETSFDEVYNSQEEFSELIDIVSPTEFELPEIEPLKTMPIHLQFVRHDLFNPQMSVSKVRYFVAESIRDNICVDIQNITFTYDNQLIINNKRAVPVMPFNMFMLLPDNLFKLLFKMSKDAFKQRASEELGKVPELDQDYSLFCDWLIKQNIAWGYIFNAKDLLGYDSLQSIEFRNPYRAVSAKMELGLKTWSVLYDKLKNLKEIRINGVLVDKNNESLFIPMEQKDIATRSLVIGVPDNYLISNIASLETGNNIMAEKFKSKLANLSAKATTLYRNFDVD